MSRRNLISTEELAKELGVKPATIHQWAHRYKDFPKSGWDLDQVKKFLAKRGRRNADPSL